MSATVVEQLMNQAQTANENFNRTYTKSLTSVGAFNDVPDAVVVDCHKSKNRIIMVGDNQSKTAAFAVIQHENGDDQLPFSEHPIAEITVDKIFTAMQNNFVKEGV